MLCLPFNKEKKIVKAFLFVTLIIGYDGHKDFLTPEKKKKKLFGKYSRTVVSELPTNEPTKNSKILMK